MYDVIDTVPPSAADLDAIAEFEREIREHGEFLATAAEFCRQVGGRKQEDDSAKQ